MAAKLLTETRDGGYCIERDHPLFAEARSLAGAKPLNLAGRRLLIQSLRDAGAEPGETLRRRLLNAGHSPFYVELGGDEAIHAFREACNLPTGTHPGPAGPSS
ncbi:hypothetical protein DQW77_06455 [Roseovarius sp. TE539]|uniref:hypothetical protein n=1 Tax=Roseovarius sp. TE539 TaxID=2249812 RepID=UPI000DDE248D|nr:hypothetical protein [Roseovarius sp. TE539]RBI75286.1 hypothetical protein DQW77_06455 [Roseovarius sp. TE539]